MCDLRKLRSFKRLKGIVVLSLFDGMSCGQIALNRVGLNVETYYASEVDKYAMQVTQHNYPDTIQIGSVVDITIERLAKFEILLNGKYIIDTRKLIIIGGSPCQGFSFAGKMKGSSTECNIDVTTLEQYQDLKSKDFKFKGQSYLFWEYVRVVQAAKPMYYFLENVKMVKKWEGMFNEAMGHAPVIINSALVSAQNRVRLYWTNIPDVTQPEDRGILIKDILQDNVEAKFYIGPEAYTRLVGNKRRNRGIVRRAKKAEIINANQSRTKGKTGPLLSRYATGVTNFGTDPYVVDGKRQDHKMKTAGLTTQRLEVREDEKSNCLTTVQKDNVLVIREATKQGYIEVQDGNCFDNTQPNSKTGRGRDMKDKSNCLTTSHQYMRYEHPRVRKLTPTECERLQTVPDEYTSIVSNSQRYKMLGNGWTVEVPAHIFKGLRR